MSVSRNHSRLGRASRSRPRNSHNSSLASIPYLPQVEDLILTDGAVGGEAADLLQDFVHPGHNPEETLTDEEEDTSDDTDGERTARANLPWWKRPSPLWYVPYIYPRQTDLFWTSAGYLWLCHSRRYRRQQRSHLVSSCTQF